MADVITLEVNQVERCKRELLRAWQEAFEHAPGFTLGEYEPFMRGVRDYIGRCNVVLPMAVHLTLQYDFLQQRSKIAISDGLDQYSIVETGFSRIEMQTEADNPPARTPFVTIEQFAQTAQTELEELQLGTRIDSAVAKRQFLSGELMSKPDTTDDTFLIFALMVMFVVDAFVQPNNSAVQGYLLRPHQPSHNFWTRWVSEGRVTEIAFDRQLLAERVNEWVSCYPMPE
jgi:hypothetical protein